MGFINIKLANVVLWTKEVNYNKQSVLLLQNKSHSFDKYSWIIKVDDYYASYIDKNTMRVYKHIQKTIVDDYYTDNEYYFNYNQKNIYAKIKNSNTKTFRDTITMQVCVKDLLTTVYYVRNINYSDLKINQKVYLPVILDTSIHNIYFRYIGKEYVNYGNNLLDTCYIIVPCLVETSTFKAGETMKVWIKANKNRVPLRMESELWIGKIVGILEKSKGLRYHETSMINN